jgi:Zn-dependent protease with chaperone function
VTAAQTTALYFDGTTVRPRAVTLATDANDLHIHGDALDRAVPLASLRATSRLANVRRVIHLPDRAQLHCDDNDWVDRLFPRRGFEALVDRLERNAAAVAASVLAIAVCAVVFVTVGLPWFAERAAFAVPDAALEAIGNQALRSLDAVVLAPSRLDPATQQRVRDAFADFVRDVPGAPGYRLEFREMRGVPNAFALPGGPIVVTDAIVKALPQTDAMLAVLAHEVGHQAGRHVMRSVIQASAVGVVAALFTSDVSSASAIVLGVPIFLLHNHYSRDYERAADAFAVDALRAHDISPEWFAYALAHIDQAALTQRTGDVDDYASSHPLTTERIETARRRAAGFEPLVVLNAATTAAVHGPGIDVDAARLAGCWTGSKQQPNAAGYRWYARFGTAGEFDIDFDDYDKDGSIVRKHAESGAWAVRRGVLSMRVSDDDGRAVDSLESYRIVQFDGASEQYVSVPADVTYAAERFDCDSDESDD